MPEPEDVNEILETVDEDDEIPFVEFDITVSPSDNSLELLAKKIEREDIIIPFYQRKFVWKIEQSSRLIESFLMGLPVPQIFLYVNSEDQLEVIDGQQRLMSVKYFFEGYFGEPDSKNRRQVFRLKGLSARSEYNNKAFDELPQREQRKLKNSTLRAINIKQLTPDENTDSVFHLFERLNTGGTLLKPQEIRNAVYRGPIVEELWRLNANKNWQQILGLKNPDKNQKDVELILRLFSLFESWNEYEKPMLRFLNKTMSQNVKFDSAKAINFKVEFARAVELVNTSLDSPFRPKGLLNSSVLESVMIAILENPSITEGELVSRYPILINDSEYQASTAQGTTNVGVLHARILLAKRILGDA